MDRLQRLVNGQKTGRPLGMYSVCSANPYVLEACMQNAKRKNSTLLIEATSNQVNQFGGYTGLTPGKFAMWIKTMSERCDLDWDRITLGGDHLGPTPWQAKSSDVAMKLSEELIYGYAAAGFQKIHLDASMRLGDEVDSSGLDKRIVASRTARLALQAEKAIKDHNIKKTPYYVIGSDVPIAGGMLDQEELIAISDVDDVKETLEETRKAFYAVGLVEAWERVIALVVRTGVEFGDQSIFRYQSKKTKELSSFIKDQPGIIYEAHSTDYQTADDLRQMVCDHFAILKVGPALTFAFREAIFSLAFIEDELCNLRKVKNRSDIVEVLDRAMKEDPSFWEKYYKGDESQLRFARKFSLSDRSRYYWTKPQVAEALQLLLNNLSEQDDIPWSLVDQFFPCRDLSFRSGRKYDLPKLLISKSIDKVVNDYSYACGEGMTLK